jgi:ribonuclease HII
VVVKPTFTEEKSCRINGYCRIAGIDEAGRGSLAGPVVAAALVLPYDFHEEWADKVADSKFVAAAGREYLYERLRNIALAVGVGVVDSAMIDLVGIAKATRLAMKTAVKQITPSPDYLLIDYFKLPEVKLPQKGVADGDTLCFSIAGASIIAKVTRDRLMMNFYKTYPGYGFADHKGYGTKGHMESLRRLGPSPIHRMSFQPVREAIGVSL